MVQPTNNIYFNEIPLELNNQEKEQGQFPIVHKTASFSPVKMAKNAFFKVKHVAREQFSKLALPSFMDSFVQRIIDYLTTKTVNIGTTTQFYKKVEGKALISEEGLSQQIQKDFNRMPNITKEGVQERGRVEIQGKPFYLKEAGELPDLSIKWQEFIPEPLKVLLPNEQHQRMAMAILTQGGLGEFADSAAAKGVVEFLYTPNEWDARIFEKNGNVFIEREARVQGKSLETGKLEKEYRTKILINITDPHAQVILTESRIIDIV